jgi:hypothetical protein
MSAYCRSPLLVHSFCMQHQVIWCVPLAAMTILPGEGHHLQQCSPWALCVEVVSRTYEVSSSQSSADERSGDRAQCRVSEACIGRGHAYLTSADIRPVNNLISI